MIRNKKKLSILICSITERARSLNNLLSSLERQSTDEVEILVEVDNRAMRIGEKRNLLLGKATGDYICYIDDDDSVTQDYIPTIINAIKSKPDCCGIKGKIYRRGHMNVFIHSIRYKSWYSEGKIYYRCPNHLNPVKRELALQVGFPTCNHGEDKTYSMKLLPLLQKEVFIPKVMYFYRTR